MRSDHESSGRFEAPRASRAAESFESFDSFDSRREPPKRRQLGSSFPLRISRVFTQLLVSARSATRYMQAASQLAPAANEHAGSGWPAAR